MADLQGTKVISQIVPPTTEDTFPTHDSIYGKGGWREVATIEERNNISRKRLREGMVVYVSETKTDYKLKSLGEDKDGDLWEGLTTKESEQIRVKIDSSMRNMRVNYELNKVPEIKMIDQEGNQLSPRIVYGEGFAWVYWQEKVNGLILIN
jgi:hypothetical protein